LADQTFVEDIGALCPTDPNKLEIDELLSKRSSDKVKEILGVQLPPIQFRSQAAKLEVAQ